MLTAPLVRLLTLRTDGEVNVLPVACQHRMLSSFVMPTPAIKGHERRVIARLVEESDKAILLAAKDASQKVSGHAGVVLQGPSWIRCVHCRTSGLRPKE